MKPSMVGTYYAVPKDWSSGESKSGTPQFVVLFNVTHMFDGAQWEGLPPGCEITGYFYPICRDGTRNDVTCEMLMKALGWDGATFESFSAADFSKAFCQLDIRAEQYNGREQLKIGWVNPSDYKPKPFARSAPEAVKSLDAKFGAALRGGKVDPLQRSSARPLPPGVRPSTPPAPGSVEDVPVGSDEVSPF